MMLTCNEIGHSGGKPTTMEVLISSFIAHPNFYAYIYDLKAIDQCLLFAL